MAGVQSQTNKNFWYAYALWQQKVTQALARRRAKAEAQARKRAEAEARAKAKQNIVVTNSMRVMFFVAMGIGLLLLSLRPSQDTKPKDEAYLRPYDDVEQSCGLLYPSATTDTRRCSVGAALLTAAGAYATHNWWQRTMAEFGTVECWFFGWNCPWSQSSPGIATIPNTLPQAQVQPFPHINTPDFDIVIPDFTLPNIDLTRGGQRIPWVQNYNAGVDTLTGECLPCTFMSVANPRFCDVDVVSIPEHGCPADHIHVFRFHQTGSCYCSVGYDDPDFRCLANKYSGPTGGVHTPLTSPATLISNPELAICTGGWKQD